jgi:hypothetical protein
MQLVKVIDGVKYVFIPLKDANTIKEMTHYLQKMKKVSPCAEACPIINKVCEMVGQI